MYSFPNLEPVCCSMSSTYCCFLTCIQVSQEAGKVLWYSHLLKNFPYFVGVYTVKGFSLVNEAEVYVFLAFFCSCCDPMDVGNLISGSSAFSKSSLNIWKFSVQMLLKPNLKDFEHYLARMWNECNNMVAWTFFDIYLLWDQNENWPLPVLWVFQIFWHTESSTWTAASFWIWNSSTGIPSPLLALFYYFLRTTWHYTHRCLVLGEWPHHCSYPSN